MQFILTAEKLPLIRILNDDKMHKINKTIRMKEGFAVLNIHLAF